MFRVQSDPEFSILATGVTSPEYVATGLTFGLTYEFKVQARNSYSYSLDSDVLALLCAFKPEAPLTVTTSNQGSQVSVTWDEPVNNGYVVDSYRFFVRESDGTTFTEETVDCVGTNSDVVANRECFLNLSTLQVAPYNLVQGDSIWLKVVSRNTYGESL